MKCLSKIHPFLFVLFYILFFYSNNFDQLFFIDFIKPLIAVLLILAILLLVFNLFYKSWIKSGLLCTLIVIFFFSYGHCYNILSSDYIIGHDFSNRYLVIFWIFSFITGIFILNRLTNNILNRIVHFLSIVSAILVSFIILNVGMKLVKKDNYYIKSDETINPNSNFINNHNEIFYRDIYYIILDAYANSRTLKDIYGYNNDDFLNFLVKNGFYIGSESRSNYSLTFLSLASSLNMEYINYLSKKLPSDSKDRAIPYEMIKNCKIVNYLKTKGYKYIHFSSGWGPTNNNNNAEIDYLSSEYGINWNESIIMFTKTTVLLPILIYFNNIQTDLRKKILFTFSKLSEVNKIKGRKFVFAHIVCPHPPYIFGSNGEEIQNTPIEMNGRIWEKKNDYLNQLTFINKQVKLLVGKILRQYKIAPIIIIQGDHGTASTFSSSTNDNWDHPSISNLQERMRIFNAYYLPNQGNSLLYKSITPVNSFRLVLNYYFKENCDSIKDECFFSSYDLPYNFIDVTEKVRF